VRITRALFGHLRRALEGLVRAAIQVSLPQGAGHDGDGDGTARGAAREQDGEET
jgi:hypothetical protein